MKPLKLLEYIHAPEDNQFDLLYPPEIRALSRAHWTPVKVARRAASFLVREPGTRVLDIGCGPGKFCIVGALATPGRFTGVEQRKQLCELAQATIEQGPGRIFFLSAACGSVQGCQATTAGCFSKQEASA
jgi:2-polyprenyl-3-methyl-5-hydroxy-6-metoxy-1,4-benzoquinol methylase